RRDAPRRLAAALLRFRLRAGAIFGFVPLLRSYRPNPLFPILVAGKGATDLGSGQPGCDLSKLARVDVIHPPSVVQKVAPARDQLSVEQDAQLARHRRPAQLQLRSDLGGTKHPERQERNDTSP